MSRTNPAYPWRLALSLLLALAAACTDGGECPDGYYRTGNLCRRLDAGAEAVATDGSVEASDAASGDGAHQDASPIDASSPSTDGGRELDGGGVDAAPGVKGEDGGIDAAHAVDGASTDASMALSDAAKTDVANGDVCSPSPCQHGGQCSRSPQGAICDCTETGYEGSRCEVDIDECASPNLCKNPEYPCVQTEPPGYTCEGHMADWPMPDAVLSANVHPSYDVDSEPGIVLDKVTGLAWQRELPAAYDRCSGNVSTAGDSCTWEEAKSYCNRLELAGHDDWRLPSKIELESILDDTRAEAPAIDPVTFPGASLKHHWTRSTTASNSQAAWLSFGHVLAMAYPKSTTALVRCVRTTSRAASGTPGMRYTVSGSSSLYPDVADRRTGLVWKKNAESGSSTLEQARTACAAYGGAWRVPTRKELLTLVNVAPVNSSPTIDPVFTGPVDPAYRSVSTLAGNTGLLIGVDFKSGATTAVQNVDALPLRCVR